jgi:hypothetical protein
MCPMNPRLLRPLARFQAPAADPFATLVSTKSTYNVSGQAISSTGYIKVEWWDATTNVYGTGVAGNNISWSKAAGGAGSKTVLIYPSDASGNLDGSLTNLTCNNNSLTSLDVSGLTALTNMTCGGNSLTSLDVSGLTSLTYLECQENSLTSLDVSGCTALAVLSCYSNPLTSLDVSDCTAMTTLSCSQNSLTTLRAVGVGANISGSYYTSGGNPVVYGGFTADNNNLSAESLDQLYTDLASTSSGLLLVLGNPGTTGDDPTIATDKGWTVYGS